MSRSRRKPYTSVCGEREDGDAKRCANRRFRRRSKMHVKSENYDRLPNFLREVSDIWGFPSDGGNFYYPEEREKLSRK